MLSTHYTYTVDALMNEEFKQVVTPVSDIPYIGYRKVYDLYLENKSVA